ncbi:hypothetical protein [Anaeromicropila herbilytica]|uniref:Uncharacterized protein n=1 Tax=Anaeromicropila herbilytica TaxID=2785025 RepID=A0A7R7EKC8_9FIRM|nr:hypothetical protein [Anaeromicropila herbilytica]BCN30196.1 hypothetical protein bsdtb5_14910 [Anaeromicropila herbilytica]
MLDRFLDNFYQVISFEKDEEFKETEFKELFISNAVLMEKDNEIIIQKNLEQHIDEFRIAIKQYPQLFELGFHERQLGYQHIEEGDTFLVSSRYEKKYCRGGKEVVEYGVNHMVIIKDNKKLKIASVLW